MTGDGERAFAEAWARALASAAYVPFTPTERYGMISGLASRLCRLVLAERVDPATARWIGSDLVAAGFATAEALEHTVALTTTRLAADLGLHPETANPRVAELTAALAAGFTAAQRDRELDQQDDVRAAAMRAQTRVEEALRESEARFVHFATHDQVTGLPNRTRFTQWLSEQIGAVAADQRVAVCCLDLDRFAEVNDSLGFVIGDRLLAAVAERLRGLAESTGWLLARFEGNQFGVLLTGGSGSEYATKAADRVLAVLAEPFRIEDLELPVTASAGVAEASVGAIPAAELIRAAQTALHWAKADGRAQWRLFRQDRADEDSERYRLSAELPRALRRDEFEIAYQPLVELATGRIVGAEALARWRHPRHGLLPARRFINLAEQSGQIGPLGNRILTRACRQASGWPAGHWQAEAWQPDAGAGEPPTPPYVSVNLAAAQLRDTGFAGYLAEVLDRYRLAPGRLQLELTEDIIVRAADTEATRRTLHAVAQLGVRIAVDDFGTGYSSMARLRELPLHNLKLAGWFARDGLTAGGQGGVDEVEFLRTLVAFGHTLGLSVTAEGIETAEQAARMHAAGCDTAQGWHLGHPGPASSLPWSP